MVNETVKRWLILGSLLLATLWLVWTMPEVENNTDIVVKATRTVKGVNTDNITASAEDVFSLSHRPLSDDKTVDIFGTQKQKTKRKVKPVIAKIKPVTKPTAPRMPFKYIGKLVENDVTKVFLMEGETLYIVSQGDKIGRNYKLKQVEEQQISLLYLPLKTTQIMSIGKTP